MFGPDRFSHSAFLLPDSPMKVLTEEKVLELREAAMVRCNYDNKGTHCNSTLSPCVFNITDDPCEQNNLADQVDLLRQLEDKLSFYKTGYVPARNVPVDGRADPAKWNNTWVPWYDELNKQKAADTMRLHHPLISPTAIIYSLVILTILIAASSIAIKQCVFNEKNDESNDLPETNKTGNFVHNHQNQQVNGCQEQHCFDNVVCTS